MEDYRSTGSLSLNFKCSQASMECRHRRKTQARTVLQLEGIVMASIRCAEPTPLHSCHFAKSKPASNSILAPALAGPIVLLRYADSAPI